MENAMENFVELLTSTSPNLAGDASRTSTIEDDDQPHKVDFTQDDIERELACEFSLDDKLYAEAALNIAVDNNIFNDVDNEREQWGELGSPATHKQMAHYQELDKLVKAVTKDHASADNRDNILPAATTLSDSDDGSFVNRTCPIQDQEHQNVLNEEQQCAHDMVINHLWSHLNGRHPPQLLVMVTGQGGTGKSTFINAISSSFEHLGAAHLIKKTALSGVAASLAGGTTLHWFASLPPMTTPQSEVWPDTSSKYIKDRWTSNLLLILWLFVDEASMCTVDLMTLLSQVVGKVRMGDRAADSAVPFGGLNIVLIGDFHQFPPVGRKASALYSTLFSRNTAVVGKAIYSQFQIVINFC
jgi:hypothetical protein